MRERDAFPYPYGKCARDVGLVCSVASPRGFDPPPTGLGAPARLWRAVAYMSAAPRPAGLWCTASVPALRDWVPARPQRLHPGSSVVPRRMVIRREQQPPRRRSEDVSCFDPWVRVGKRSPSQAPSTPHGQDDTERHARGGKFLLRAWQKAICEGRHSPGLA